MLEFWPKARNIYTNAYIHFCVNLEWNSPNIRRSEKCFRHKSEKNEAYFVCNKFSLNFTALDILKQEEAKAWQLLSYEHFINFFPLN
jgi:hypothetical protein